MCVYIYIYIYIHICRKIDNNDPSGRRDLLRGRHYSISVLLNHHQDYERWYLANITPNGPDDSSVELKRYSVDLSINLSFHLVHCYQFFYILLNYNPLFTFHIYIYIYIYGERDRERENEREQCEGVRVCVCIYVYIVLPISKYTSTNFFI